MTRAGTDAVPLTATRLETRGSLGKLLPPRARRRDLTGPPLVPLLLAALGTGGQGPLRGPQSPVFSPETVLRFAVRLVRVWVGRAWVRRPIVFTTESRKEWTVVFLST